MVSTYAMLRLSVLVTLLMGGLVGARGASAEWVGDARPAKSPPVRIVSLAPSLTETIAALGHTSRLVGVTRFDDYPEAVKALPKVGGFVDPEPEAVMSLKPDLVVAVPTNGGRGRIDTLARLGTPVLLLPATTLDDLWSSISTLGQLLHCEKDAQKLVTSLQQQLKRLHRENATKPALRVLLVLERRPLVVAGPGSFLDSLLPMLNVTNVVRSGGAFVHLDVETLASYSPDVVVDMSMGPDANTVLARKRVVEFWQRQFALAGLAHTRVVPFLDSGLLRLGPRLPHTMSLLAERLR
jgi:iron complex transport system substrate-binding protein